MSAVAWESFEQTRWAVVVVITDNDPNHDTVETLIGAHK